MKGEGFRSSFRKLSEGSGCIRSERKQNLEVKLAGKETAAGSCTPVLDGGRSRMCPLISAAAQILTILSN